MWYELLATLLILVFIIVFVKALVAYLLTHPRRRGISHTPADFGLPYEECELNTVDGIIVRGWFIPHSKQSPTVILLHPYRRNKGDLLPLARDLYLNSYNVLLLDFRGHGESEGRAVSFGFKEVKDIASAIKYIERRGLDLSSIGLVGMSMGAAAAILYSSQEGGVRAIVADSSFKTLTSVIGNVTRFPTVLYVCGLYLAYLFAGLPLSYKGPIEYVDRVSPTVLLIIHCKGDPIVNVNDAYALYERARDPKELWIIDENVHTGLYIKKGEEYRRRIIDFLNRYLK